jgi:hypothetical protein
MKKPKVNSVGIIIKVACGMGFIAMPFWSCSLTLSWFGWSGTSVSKDNPAADPARLFPPRPDRRRSSLPAIHRQVVEWLRERAILRFFSIRFDHGCMTGNHDFLSRNKFRILYG